jgi:hypothetical protein
MSLTISPRSRRWTRPARRTAKPSTRFAITARAACSPSKWKPRRCLPCRRPRRSTAPAFVLSGSARRIGMDPHFFVAQLNEQLHFLTEAGIEAIMEQASQHALASVPTDLRVSGATLAEPGCHRKSGNRRIYRSPAGVHAGRLLTSSSAASQSKVRVREHYRTFEC